MAIGLKKEFTTYLPVLLRAVQATTGPIMELGAGFSTTVLHWLCAESRRPLMTYEVNKENYIFAKKFQSRSHRVRLVDNWDNIDAKTHWSAVLINQDTQRAQSAILLKDSADFIILHNSDREELYGYDKVYPHFKNIYHWMYSKPYTTVVSNFKSMVDIVTPEI